MIFDYVTLKIMWWVILGVVIIAFAIVIGCDLGVVMLLSYLGKDDNERSVIISTTPPLWKANQLWFVLAGGAVVAAWPMVYAVAFSSMPFVLLMLLLALFLRPVGFVFRDLIAYEKWRSGWDKALFIIALISAFTFGAALGNLLKGIPFQLESDMQIVYPVHFRVLLNAFAILAGLLSLSMSLMQGAVYLQIKTAGETRRRSKKTVLFFTINMLVLFAIAVNWITNVQGYHITSEVFPNAPPNPLSLSVKQEAGLWLDNYGHLPDLWLLPASVFIWGLLTIIFSRLNQPVHAFIFSSISVGTIMLTVGCALFPFLIPSSLSPNSSLTVWDYSSDKNRLSLMIWEIVIFIPLLVMYSCWVFKVIRLLTQKKT